MSYVLDTAGLSAPERVAAVHDAMMHASAPCQVIHEDPAGVHARMELWEFGGSTIFTHRSSGIRLLRTDRLARQDAMPVVALSVQLGSQGRFEQRRRQKVVPTGGLLAVDLSGAYDYSWSGDGAAGCIQIPFDRLGLPVDAVRRAAPEIHASPYHRMVTDHVAHLARDPAALLADPATTTVAHASVDLVRALLASALAAVGADGMTGPATRQAMAETLPARVRAYARRHLADPGLSPATIAAAHHVSVRHLYQVFAAAGQSLEQWIIEERLQRARHELARPDGRRRSIAAVARRCGFRDPTHFTRRFKARYGMLPSQWRRSL